MILRALLRLIGEVALWTALVAVVAGVVAVGARWVLRQREPIELVALLGAAVVGALLFAGLSDRLGLPQPVVIDIGRRPLPLVWVAGGALAGVVATGAVRARMRGAQAPDRVSSSPGRING